MKSGQLWNFRRIKASKPFQCCECGETIEIGQHYWRLLAAYKYCDGCYIIMLNRHGWGFSKNSVGGFMFDKFWYAHPNTLGEQLKFFEELDEIPCTVRKGRSLGKGGRLW